MAQESTTFALTNPLITSLDYYHITVRPSVLFKQQCSVASRHKPWKISRWKRLLHTKLSLCHLMGTYLNWQFLHVWTHSAFPYVGNAVFFIPYSAYTSSPGLWFFSSEAQWYYPSVVFFIQTIHVMVAPTPKRKGDETTPLCSLKENCSFHRNSYKSN